MEKSEAMFAMVDRWQASGLSQLQYCAQHNIAPHTLRYWNRRKKDCEQEVEGFRLIEPKISTVMASVNYPNGVRVEVPADLAIIRALIHLY